MHHDLPSTAPVSVSPCVLLDTETVQLQNAMYLVDDCSSRAAVVPQLPGSFPELVVSQLDIQATPLLLSHAVLIKAQPPQPLWAEEPHLLQSMHSTLERST